MQSALFYKYLENCFDRLEGSLEKFLQSGKMACLFRFRVSIKKIRACVKCLEAYHGKKEFKHLRKQLKKIFQLGGDLRQYHLYDTWLRRLHFVRLGRMMGLDKTIKDGDEDMISQKNHIREVISDSKKLLLNYADNITQEQVYDFYVDLIQNRMSLLIDRPGKKQWHFMRKEFKRILYARHWQDEFGLKLLSNRQSTYLDEFQHLIGYWHDNEVMIEWMVKQQEDFDYNDLADERKKRVAEAFSKAIIKLKRGSRQLTRRVNHKQQLCAEVMGPLQRRLKNVAAVLV